MLNKLISSIILSCSFAVMPAAGKAPDTILSLFISPNRWVSTIRLALALLVFFGCFKTFSKYFIRYSNLRGGLLVAGTILITSLGTIFYDYLKPLDLMIILEAGIITTSLALTAMPTAKNTLPSTKNAKTLPELRQKTA